MITRVSDNQKLNLIADNLSRLKRSAQSALDQLSSGKRINSPSDDPEGAQLVMNLRSAGASIDQYRQNIVNASTWLQATETDLDAIDKLLSQAQGIAKDMADASDAERADAAGMIQKISDQILAYANDELDGRYLFSGGKAAIQPFAANSAPPPRYLYQGDSSSLTVSLGQDFTSNYSITGDSVFPPAADGGVALFQTLDDLKTALLANDTAAIQATMEDLQAGGKNVQDGISRAGSLLSNLQFADNHLTYLKNKVSSLISDTESTDTSRITMEYQMQLLALNASYEVAAKINQQSIFDFL